MAQINYDEKSTLKFSKKKMSYSPHSKLGTRRESITKQVSHNELWKIM